MLTTSRSNMTMWICVTSSGHTSVAGQTGEGVTKWVFLRHSGHVRVALSTSAKVLTRQLRMQGRQKQCSHSSSPKHLPDGSSFRSTGSKQMPHSICTLERLSCSSGLRPRAKWQLQQNRMSLLMDHSDGIGTLEERNIGYGT